MAQPIKVSPSSLNFHSAPNGREGAISDVASITAPAVDAINPGISSYFDNNSFTFSREKYGDHRNDNAQNVNKRNHFGILNTSSESFVSLMELSSQAFVDNTLEKNKNHLFLIDTAKAIDNYELNSELVTERREIRGSKLSLLL